jgi:type VI protein secretion system component Hcp
MRARLVSAMVLLAGSLCVIPDADAWVYMRVDGLNGDVTAKGREGWFRLLSFQVGHAAPPSKGLLPFQPLGVSKAVDSGSVWFAAHAANGKRLPAVTVDFTVSSADEPLLYRVVLRDVALENYKVVGYDNSGKPEEAFELRYSRIEWTYFPPGKPPIQYRWDVATGTPY